MGSPFNAKRIAIVALAMVGFLVIGALAGVYIFLGKLVAEEPPIGASPNEPVEERAVEKKGEPVNVLFMGVDAEIGRDGKPITSDWKKLRTRTDTMMVISFDSDDGRLSILSIPRDTRVDIPGHGQQKVAHAHAFGGPELAVKTVSGFLGIPIHYYVRTNFEGFGNIIDILGGVEIDVPQDMYYEDPYQDLVINLKKGKQVLDGDQALQFVRFRRYPNGDIGRVEAQQKFIKALFDQSFRLGTILKLPDIAREVLDYVDTNMPPSRVMKYAASAATSLRNNSIQMAVLPGWFSDTSTDWIVDRAGASLIVSKLIMGVDIEANSRVKLKILNGTDVNGAAARLAESLRGKGYKVVEIGNAPEGGQRQTVLIHNGLEDTVLKGLFGELPEGLSVREEAESLDDGIDAVIIIGSDLVSQ